MSTTKDRRPRNLIHAIQRFYDLQPHLVGAAESGSVEPEILEEAKVLESWLEPITLVLQAQTLIKEVANGLPLNDSTNDAVEKIYLAAEVLGQAAEAADVLETLQDWLHKIQLAETARQSPPVGG